MVGASGSGAGSELTLEAGTAKSTDVGGAVNIRGGSSSQGAGGDMGLVSGRGAGSDSSSGAVYMVSAAGSEGASGSVSVGSGEAAMQDSGSLVLSTGSSARGEDMNQSLPSNVARSVKSQSHVSPPVNLLLCACDNGRLGPFPIAPDTSQSAPSACAAVETAE